MSALQRYRLHFAIFYKIYFINNYFLPSIYDIYKKLMKAITEYTHFSE